MADCSYNSLNSNIPFIKAIRLTSGQVIKENEENLFGERVFREFHVSVAFSDDSVDTKSYKMGQLLKSKSGVPIMIFLGTTVLKDKCSRFLLRGSYVAFIDVEKHYCLLKGLITCMNSVSVATENEDEFQKKTDAVSEFLAASELKDAGVNISSIISIERSVIKDIESLNLLGQYPLSLDLNSFLLSTLEDNIIIPTANSSYDNIGAVEEDLSVLGIILFALYQQRCNNPPDSRFEVAPEPQLLDEELIPFSIENYCDENTVTTIFTPSSPHDENIVPENDMTTDNDEERKEDPEDEPLPVTNAAKKRGGRPKKTATTVPPTNSSNSMMPQPPPKIAKRKRVKNIRFLHDDDTTTQITTKKRGRKPAAKETTTGTVVQRLPQHAPQTSHLTSTFAIGQQEPVIVQHHPNTTAAAANLLKRGRDIDSDNYSTQHHHNNQQLPVAGGAFQMEMMNKFHEYDKQNAVLRAQLENEIKNKEATAKIQQATKDLCFQILDKGADLTKQGATVSAENNTALSTTISTVFAATRFRNEEASSVPTVVNHFASTDESTSLSRRVSISQQQQDNKPQPPPQSPHPAAVPHFYPTIQVNAAPSLGYSAQQHYFAHHQQQAHTSYYHQGGPSPYMAMASPPVTMHGVSVPWVPPPAAPCVGGYFPPHQQPPTPPQPYYGGGYYNPPFF